MGEISQIIAVLKEHSVDGSDSLCRVRDERLAATILVLRLSKKNLQERNAELEKLNLEAAPQEEHFSAGQYQLNATATSEGTESI